MDEWLRLGVNHIGDGKVDHQPSWLELSQAMRTLVPGVYEMRGMTFSEQCRLGAASHTSIQRAVA